MREYIEKQKLIDHLFLGVDEEEASEENTGEIITFEDIDRLPTVTQVELESLAYNRGARAFAEKLKDETDCSKEEKDIIDELLEEMGCCDE